MNIFDPDLVIPRRLGPSRAERVADWIARQDEYRTWRRRGYMGIQVGIASCRNIIIHHEIDDDVAMNDHDAAMTALACLRRVQEMRTPKDLYARMTERLSCLSAFALSHSQKQNFWFISAHTACPWAPARIKGLEHPDDSENSDITFTDITPEEWRRNSPSVVSIHAERDITLSAMAANHPGRPEDDPVGFLREASRGASLLRDPSSDPWIQPSDEVAR